MYGDCSHTERVGGYATFNLSVGWRLNDISSFVTKPYIKLNMFNLTVSYANNIGALLLAAEWAFVPADVRRFVLSLQVIPAIASVGRYVGVCYDRRRFTVSAMR